jgi:hypothetical protein
MPFGALPEGQRGGRSPARLVARVDRINAINDELAGLARLWRA